MNRFPRCAQGLAQKLLLSALLLAVTGTAVALDANTRKTIESALAKSAPNVKIAEIAASPIANLAEVTLADQHVLYVTHDGKHLISGEVFATANGKNLTQVKQTQLRKTLLDGVGANQRIVFAPSSKPKYKVTVFTDIDCGYCRKLHSELADYHAAGIQIDYLFYPRSGPGTPSFSKAESVWCAIDKNATFTAAKNGQDPVAKACNNPVSAQFELGRKAGVDRVGTPSIVLPDGTLIPGYVPAAELAARLNAASAG
jgi:thiol:disulfide interchange protein DsbC